MLGYSLHKYHSGHRNEYAHLQISVHFNDGYGWQKISEFTWQTDKQNNDCWYAFHLNMGHRVDNRSMFAEYLKFCQKVEKSDMYNQSPENVLAWLENMRGMVRLIEDLRLRQFVTLEDYLKTKDLTCYKVMIGSEYVLDVLAYSENHAESQAAKKIANGNSYNWKSHLRNWNNARFEEYHALKSYNPTFEDFLNPDF